MLKKIAKYLLFLILGLGILYFIGPKPKVKPIDYATTQLTSSLENVELIVSQIEKKSSGIRIDNQSRIIWADSIKKSKTEFVILYLHGFSASFGEGEPVHREVAKNFGMNLFIPRLHAHGLEDIDAFKNFDNDLFFESAQQALSIAKNLGEKVIVMSCSTGSTLAVMLAKSNPEIFAHIMYSPNIDIKDPTSELVIGPWGKQLTKVVMNGEYNKINYKPEAKPYWYSEYHIDGIIALKSMLEQYMTEENFKLIHQPLFLGYYYIDENRQDQIVSVPRMLEFYEQIKTPIEKKRKLSFINGQSHVICSSIMNPNYRSVIDETCKFLREICLIHEVEVKINQ